MGRLGTSSIVRHGEILTERTIASTAPRAQLEKRSRGEMSRATTRSESSPLQMPLQEPPLRTHVFPILSCVMSKVAMTFCAHGSQRVRREILIGSSGSGSPIEAMAQTDGAEHRPHLGLIL